MFAERIDLEAQHLAIRASHRLRLQINLELVPRAGFNLLEKLIDFSVTEVEKNALKGNDLAQLNSVNQLGKLLDSGSLAS